MRYASRQGCSGLLGLGREVRGCEHRVRRARELRVWALDKDHGLPEGARGERRAEVL